MAKKLWGGRFGKGTDPLVEAFSRSVQYDHKLAKYDIIGSLYHVLVLESAGILSPRESSALRGALNGLLGELAAGTFAPAKGFEGADDEDIHTYIQNKLQKKVGDLVLKLHTARSRNDQVAFATKLYCKAALGGLQQDIEACNNSLEALAAANAHGIMPGFTHMQHAQPVTVRDYLGVYIEMLGRDALRLEQVSKAMRVSMGAGALAGTPIDAQKYNAAAAKLFKSPDFRVFGPISLTMNSLDAVSDRDFVIEILSALAIIGTHLSRFAEDMVIWSTSEFAFIGIDDAFCTGSSLMPQKKNPDALELIRGYAGRLNGNLVSVLTMMKGLPLTYNRDMQLDKEPLFNSFEIVSVELKVLAGLIRTLKFNESAMRKHLEDESLYATDIVYYLVDRQVPFKTAHTIVGELIKHSLDSGISIKEMAEPDLRRFSNVIVKKELVKLFDPLVSVKSKRSVKRGKR